MIYPDRVCASITLASPYFTRELCPFGNNEYIRKTVCISGTTGNAFQARNDAARAMGRHVACTSRNATQGLCVAIWVRSRGLLARA